MTSFLCTGPMAIPAYCGNRECVDIILWAIQAPVIQVLVALPAALIQGSSKHVNDKQYHEMQGKNWKKGPLEEGKQNFRRLMDWFPGSSADIKYTQFPEWLELGNNLTQYCAKLTGILDVLRNSSSASSDPSVEAWTYTPRSASLMDVNASFNNWATSS